LLQTISNQVKINRCTSGQTKFIGTSTEGVIRTCTRQPNW